MATRYPRANKISDACVVPIPLDEKFLILWQLLLRRELRSWYLHPSRMRVARMIFAYLVVAIASVGNFAADGADRTAEIRQLRDQILTTFDKSVAACSVYQNGSPECVKKHFEQSYKWYILGEKDFAVGPPGTPGPLLR